ncbi:MAG: YceI family protein [Alphaproteobacteria bacterium]|nr:YceI family protein [Alphaproteobacteria bacterium]
MFRQFAATTALIAGLTFAAATAQAAPVKYEFDKAHTQITFSVNHLGFSFSQGRFTDFDGHFMFDQETPANSSVEVAIEADSVYMGTDAWDEHVENADFLDAEKFEKITFKSTKIDVTGADTANITGDLTIKDVTKPVVLATKLNKVGAHPMSGKQHAGFSATTTIKRSEFGVNYGLPNVGDDLMIRIEVEGSAAAADAKTE